jgi:DNA-directed RNA polymerase specialized sigma24 family protein
LTLRVRRILTKPSVSGWEFGGLTAIVERLSWQQRVLLTYRYVEDLTLSDIALRVGGLSESAISQRLSTIRRIVETEMKVA